jgi:hypothetical protein
MNPTKGDSMAAIGDCIETTREQVLADLEGFAQYLPTLLLDSRVLCSRAVRASQLISKAIEK